MRTEQEARRLKRQLAHRRRGQAMPKDVRAAALEYVRRRRSEGAAQQRIADEIGVSQRTVSCWLREVASEVKGSLLPIEIKGDGGIARNGIVVTTPRGLRIDGLDIDALCAVIASFG
jgi:hypothetical protein